MTLLKENLGLPSSWAKLSSSTDNLYQATRTPSILGQPPVHPPCHLKELTWTSMRRSNPSILDPFKTVAVASHHLALSHIMGQHAQDTRSGYTTREHSWTFYALIELTPVNTLPLASPAATTQTQAGPATRYSTTST